MPQARAAVTPEPPGLFPASDARRYLLRWLRWFRWRRGLGLLLRRFLQAALVDPNYRLGELFEATRAAALTRSTVFKKDPLPFFSQIYQYLTYPTLALRQPTFIGIGM